MTGPGAHAPILRNQALVSFVLFLLALYFAWKMGGWIADEDMGTVTLSFLAVIVAGIAVRIVRDWRSGFYLFLVWLLFEDLIRKYLGNNMYIYFAKDVLVLFTCLSLFVAIRRGREPAFRPPFLLSLTVFFWLAVLQVFNPHSPSVLYGLLGLKMYFYYVPLMFVGYALMRNDEDLHRFLIANMALAGVISVLGIIQGIVGPGFLNPATLAPEIRELGTLERESPISHIRISLPTATFVSTGRFAWYLILAWILTLGTAGYLLLHSRRGRKLAFPAVGLVAVAAMLSGSRGAVVYCAASAVVLAAGFLWGAPWRWRHAHRLWKAIRRSAIVAALSLAVFVFFFPTAIGSRWAFYSETLSPESSSSEVAWRTWDYPIQNLMLAFTDQNWIVGNGIGTASLGVQYVSAFLGEFPPQLGVESGYGALIVELGILGPVLWLVWTTSLLIAAWKIVLSLKETPLFPLGFAIFWFIFVLLVPFTYGGFQAFQNYVYNAYLWLLIGVLFRLPSLLVSTSQMATVASIAKRPRWFFR